MKVRLTRKHADRIDGIDLSSYQPGDLIELSASEARLLIAEQWGFAERRERAESTAHRRRSTDMSTKPGC
jgi:hypothetical protein